MRKRDGGHLRGRKHARVDSHRSPSVNRLEAKGFQMEEEDRVAGAGQTTGWRGARSRTFCGRNGYPRVVGEFSPSLPRAASAR
jgi:hypothetical protein